MAAKMASLRAFKDRRREKKRKRREDGTPDVANEVVVDAEAQHDNVSETVSESADDSDGGIERASEHGESNDTADQPANTKGKSALNRKFSEAVGAMAVASLAVASATLIACRKCKVQRRKKNSKSQRKADTSDTDVSTDMPERDADSDSIANDEKSVGGGNDIVVDQADQPPPSKTSFRTKMAQAMGMFAVLGTAIVVSYRKLMAKRQEKRNNPQGVPASDANADMLAKASDGMPINQSSGPITLLDDQQHVAAAAATGRKPLKRKFTEAFETIAMFGLAITSGFKAAFRTYAKERQERLDNRARAADESAGVLPPSGFVYVQSVQLQQQPLDGVDVHDHIERVTKSDTPTFSFDTSNRVQNLWTSEPTPTSSMALLPQKVIIPQSVQRGASVPPSAPLRPDNPLLRSTDDWSKAAVAAAA